MLALQRKRVAREVEPADSGSDTGPGRGSLWAADSGCERLAVLEEVLAEFRSCVGVACDSRRTGGGMYSGWTREVARQ